MDQHKMCSLQIPRWDYSRKECSGAEGQVSALLPGTGKPKHPHKLWHYGFEPDLQSRQQERCHRKISGFNIL
ncbi:hypothetical protein PoB_006969600 [Plakobranchus ocellatus]|uniref:Uncharacterized protein n=1 Tax=Plakobranchus ocellatus TaxID=259542 RepID=A0AAV4DG91_9GAST|nr:hypothetical protein PoB_006969600 [Plakobranchus ocellatus]